MLSHYLFSMPAGLEWLVLLFGLASIIFWIVAIIDVVRSKFQDETTKIIWLLVVILIGFLGAIIYWIFGRSGRVQPE